MRFIPASDDLHRAATQLQFQYKNLVPDPSKPKTWRVPKQTLAEPKAFWDLMQLFNRTEVWKYPGVVQAAESRGRRMRIKSGPTWYLMGRGYSTGPTELFVGLIGQVPCNLPGSNSGMIATVETREGGVPDGENSQELDDHAGLQDGAHEIQENLNTGLDILAYAASRPQQRSIEIEAITAALREKLEFVIRKNTDVHHSDDLPALRVGDRIELTSLEDLEVKSGLLPILAWAYEEEKIKDGAGDEVKG